MSGAKQLKSVLLEREADPEIGIDHMAILLGRMPRRRCGLVRMGWYKDARSNRFLGLKIELLASTRSDAAVVEVRRDICKAMPINQRLTDRDMYLEQVIEMLAPRVGEGIGLAHVAGAIDQINAGWDLLETFKALEAVATPA